MFLLEAFEREDRDIVGTFRLRTNTKKKGEVRFSDSRQDALQSYHQESPSGFHKGFSKRLLKVPGIPTRGSNLLVRLVKPHLFETGFLTCFLPKKGISCLLQTPVSLPKLLPKRKGLDLFPIFSLSDHYLSQNSFQKARPRPGSKIR